MNRDKFLQLGGLILFVCLIPSLFMSLNTDLVYDDLALIEDHVYVVQSEWTSIWTKPHWSGIARVTSGENLYRPIFLSLLSIFRSWPGLLKIFMILSHFLIGIFLFKLIPKKENYEYTDIVYFLPAFWFLFHPANVEANIQIVGLMESLPLLFGLVGIYYAASNPWLSVLAAAFAPGMKEIGFLSAGMTVLALLKNRKYQSMVSLCGVLLLWLMARWNVYGSFFAFPKQPYALLNPLVEMNVIDASLSKIALLGHNLRIAFYPFALSSDYSRGTLPLPSYLLDIWFIVGAVFIYFVFRYLKHMPMAVIMSFSTLLPTLHLTGNVGIVFAERFGYGFRLGLAYLSLTILAKVNNSDLKNKLYGNWRVVVAASSVGLLLWYGQFSNRTYEWRDMESLAKADLMNYPGNSKLHFNLGMAMGGKSRWEEAKPAFLRSVELAPDFPEAHYRLGIVYRELKDEENAQNHWRIAASLGYNIQMKSK